MADIFSDRTLYLPTNGVTGGILYDRSVDENRPAIGLKFDGVGGNKSLLTDAIPDTFNTQISFCGRARNSVGATYGRLFAPNDGQAAVGVTFDGGPGASILAMNFGGYVVGVTRLATPNNAYTYGQWFHYAATFDGSVARIYVDGILKASGPISSPLAWPAGVPIRLSGWGTNATNPVVGDAADFQVYNYTLTPSEIFQLSNGVIPAVPPIHRWALQGDFSDSGSIGGADGVPQGGLTFADAVDGPGRARHAELFGTNAILENMAVAGPGGEIPGAVQFNGTDQYALFPEVVSAANNVPETYSVWLKPGDNAGLKQVFGSESSDLSWFRVNSAETLDFSGTLVGDSLPINAWSHVCVVRGAAASPTTNDCPAKVYINGSLVFSGTLTFAFSQKIRLIGARSTVAIDRFWLGAMAEIEIFQREFGTEDVEALYRKGRSPEDFEAFHLVDVANEGTTLVDASGSGNNATLEGGKTLATTRVAGPGTLYPHGVTLDGTNDFIQWGELPASGNFTVSGFVRFGSTVGDATSRTFASCFTNVGGNTSADLFNSVVEDAFYHHVSAVFKGSTVEFYIDGILRGSAVYDGGSWLLRYLATANKWVFVQNTQPKAALRFGASPHDPGFRWIGDLSGLRVHELDLSAVEVDDLVDAGDVLVFGLRGHWKLDEPVGALVARNQISGPNLINSGEEFVAGNADTYGTLPVGWVRYSGTDPLVQSIGITADGHLRLESENLTGNTERIGVSQNLGNMQGIPVQAETRFRILERVGNPELGGVTFNGPTSASVFTEGYEIGEWYTNVTFMTPVSSSALFHAITSSVIGDKLVVEVDYVRVFRENYGTVEGVTFGEPGPGGLLARGATLNGTSNRIESRLGGILKQYPFTLSGWVRPTAANGRVAFSVSGGSDIYYSLRQSIVNVGTWSSANRNQGSLGGCEFPEATFEVEEWQHVAITFVSDTVQRIFVNGEFKGEATQDSVSFHSTTNFLNVGTIYQGAQVYSWAGDVADVRLHNLEIQADDVARLYVMALARDVRLFDPSKLRRGMVDRDGNLKSSLVTSRYTGGIPTSADQLRPSLVDPDGLLKGHLCTRDGGLKPSLLRPEEQ